jgi:3-dehydroquinate synthetase
LGYCDISLQRRIEDILESVRLPTRIPSHIDPDALLLAMQHDKKKRAGQLRFVLLRGIGQAFVSDEVSAKDIKDTVSALSR